jgi:predicted nucleic-acid-binding Zn-ribbon protein
MKHSLHCPRCGCRRIWNVRNVREHVTEGSAPLGRPQHLDPLEAMICADCGYVEWYASQPRALQPDGLAAIAPLNDHRLHCQSCDAREHLLIARFEEMVSSTPQPWTTTRGVPLAVLFEKKVPAGTFAVVVCVECGLMSWFACDLPSLAAEIERPCARCGALWLAPVERVEEVGGHRLPITMKGVRGVGHFSLEICIACGFTDWLGRELHRLHDDGKDLRLLEGKGEAAARPERTPYR